jgi:hypothetical protein
VLRSFMGAVSYVTGTHSFRFGATLSNGDWRLIEARTGDVAPITYNNGAPQSVSLRLPMDARNGIKQDLGFYVQDRWSVHDRVTLNLGLRYEHFIGESRESEILPNRFNAGVKYGECSDGKADPRAGCAGEVQNWKDISPRVGLAWDVFGNGRTAVKASIARYVAGQQVAVARQANPVEVLTRTDTRTWRDLDGNGLPFGADGNIQLNELTASAATPTFGRNVSTVSYDPGVLSGWGKRGYNFEWTFAAQHALTDRLSINGGYFQRRFGNQTFTDDLRFDADSYDYFCVTAPSDPDLPGGGGYQVCGVPDLKPAVFAQGLPANNLIRFDDDFGGTTDKYQGVDVNLEGRFRNGAFLKGGLAAGSRLFDTCNLAQAGIEYGAWAQYEDGSEGCRREYPFRPDLKISGSYPLPFGIQLAGTYQYTRGVQAGGTGGTSLLANWTATSATVRPFLGRNWTGVAARSIGLIREGDNFGEHNLNQLDLRFGKRFDMGRARLRVDFDIYNIFNSSWPFSINNTYSTAASSAWQRPTNVLQHRFFKLGGQFSF